VTFSITARLTAPVAHWQLVFGDGTERSGGGPPPASVPHTYAREGVYEATLAVYQSPPFAPQRGSSPRPM
jgi:hypothetical protein